jgi:hypothetical protein
MKKIFLLALLLLMSFIDVSAQQAPHYTQYMYNTVNVNPAYAGSRGVLSVLGLASILLFIVSKIELFDELSIYNKNIYIIFYYTPFI